MKKSLLILLIIISVHNQLVAQYRIDTIATDFNKDQVVDTLIDSYEIGSTFGGRDLKLISGKTNEEFELSNYRCYCSFKNVITLPQKLLLKENKPFLNQLEEKLLPPQRDAIDSSLEWLISAELTVQPLDSHPLFECIVEPTTRWEENRLTIPKTYYVPVSGDTLQRLDVRNKNDSKIKRTQGYLVYNTNGHNVKNWDSIVPVIQNETYQVYKTPHAIFVRKDKRYKWLFISDVSSTGAPDKLRWHSINQVQLVGNYLIVHQDVPPNSVYSIHVINIETQRVGRLNYEFSSNNGTDNRGMSTFKILNNHIVFTEYGVQELVKVPLKKIFNALDNY